MTLKTRIILIALPVVAGIVGYLYTGSLLGGLEEEPAKAVDGARDWLAVFAVLYVINYALAWRYRTSWTLTLARSLLCGLGAYLCISNLVDLFGENRELVWQILGADGPGEKSTVLAARGNLVGWGVSLIMAVVCIAVGFEKEAGGEAEENYPEEQGEDSGELPDEDSEEDPS